MTNSPDRTAAFQEVRQGLQATYIAAGNALAVINDRDDRAVLSAIKDQASDQIDKINDQEST